MASDGRVVFEIDGDNRNIKNVLHDTTNSIEQESKKWDNAGQSASGGITSSFTSALTKIGSAFAAAQIGQKLMEFGSQAIEAASDLREVQNVVDVTFGESASTIESWSKTAQSQFGLTETQAKRFASTLGAMMKSSGLAGEEIVGMSTDLAGLAADMASFYNLDFETAFQKIRSGISGETEPLKQLGINMSVANLEAYAMTQGITKAFDKMSQGEQTMLRYQYLMQATADAQGDFARTADGYANSRRRIETAIDSMKTSAGTLLMNFVEPLTSGLADVLTSMTSVPERTVLDEFADIDLKTAEKLAEIEETSSNARALVGVLEELQNTQLTNATVSEWLGTLSGNLTGLDGAIAAAKSGDFAGTLTGIADAMEIKTGVDATQWTTLLTAVSANLPGATDATDSDDQKTAKWLAAAAAAADDLGGEYPGLWEQFMDTLGSENTKNALGYMAGGQAAADALGSLGLNAKNLDGTENNKWSTFLSTLATADPTAGMFGDDAKAAASNVKILASALSGNDPSKRQAAWAAMLGTLSANADGVSKLTEKSAEETKKWLEDLAAAANTLDADDTEGWQTLFEALKNGFTGLELDGSGAEMFAQLAQGFANLGTQSNQAEKALNALGIDTTNVTDKQELWLKTCQKLVKTIPGLSEIINTETGEIKGGIPAIKNYIQEYENANKKIIAMQALRQKEEALAAKRVQMADYELEYKAAYEAQKEFEAAHEQLAKTLKEQGLLGVKDSNDPARKQYMELLKATQTAKENHIAQSKALTEAEEKMRHYKKAVEDMPGDVDKFTESTEDATNATQQFAAAQKEVENAVKAANSALEEVEKYYDNAFKGIEKALESSHALFGSVETPAQKAKKEIQSLEAEKKKLLESKKDTSTIELKLQGAHEAEQSIDKMTTGLKQQIAYYQNYASMMERARQLGYSEDVLSSLADGSAESYDYLAALTADSIQEGDQRIEELNNSFKQAASERESLTKQLTDQALSTDQAFQSIVQSASDAIAGLNLGEQASEAMQGTVQGIANGIAAQIPAVQKQVDALNAVLNRLNKAGGFSFGSGILTFSGGKVSKGLVTAEPLAIGMDYVPFDNFLAALHEGESVLTAEEAKLWRDFKYGGAASRNSIDYDALGATVRDNVHTGGNVYLDGQTVGRVISARQADSYRALERSGYQQ